jgi:hypothetical protein
VRFNSGSHRQEKNLWLYQISRVDAFGTREAVARKGSTGLNQTAQVTSTGRLLHPRFASCVAHAARDTSGQRGTPHERLVRTVNP